MADIAFPTLTRSAPRDVEWGVLWNTQVHASPLTQAVRTVELPGARWQVVFKFGSLEEADAALLQAHLMKLRGRVNRSLIMPWQRSQPRGTIAGTPLVAGASQTGSTLAIDGCTAGTTLKTGDFFMVGSGTDAELKMVTADATANGSGAMSVTFEPPLRAAPADNAAITTTNPTGRFMLASDDVRWNTAPGKYSDFSLQFVEAFA